jgi:tRNA-2-methylthio-N6-dimethylallyladenosine synthase
MIAALSMKPEALYIHTIGCQMNVYDSGQIAARLSGMGYEQTSSPRSADLIIVNTCTIRAKAEQKAYSFLGRLARLKRKNANLIIGIGGCVAQQDGEKVLTRLPFIDIVFGTQAIDRLPEIIRQVKLNRKQIVDVGPEKVSPASDFIVDDQTETAVSRFVTIMRGCDNYCSYCVVPYVRGRESSREPESIIAEIRSLVGKGVREITLLGQNVNSYGKKAGLCSFAELLARIDAIDGLLRIRFTTSHPKDLNADLMAAFRSLDKLCNHIHLPVQSGANTVLNRMNRKYTRELYLDKVTQLRDTCSDIAVTSDVIVGFPGETEADFEATLKLISTIQFDGIFAFQYSDRPNAASVGFPEKIPEPQKRERLHQLLAMQEGITKKKNQSLLGSCQSVLIDGLSKKEMFDHSVVENAAVQWTGRTTTNKIVNFSAAREVGNREMFSPGNLIDVRIEKAFFHSLQGIPIMDGTTAEDAKGAKYYAA